MEVRLIASDLDGTLFGPDSVPEPRTVQAVNAAVEAGMIFAAVTGRSHFGGAERVTGQGTKMHWFIGSNGGHRLNATSGELEERLVFTADDVRALLGNVPNALPDVGFGFEHHAGFTYDDNFKKSFPQAFDGGARVDTATWASDDIGKIFAAHTDLTAAQVIEATNDFVPPGTHVTTSGGSFVEFTPPGADKGLALGRLCDQLGIAANEVVAFGDNHNDISMLRLAGRGIAMANATAEAKAAADEVTASNLDFGVAHVIEALLPPSATTRKHLG